MGRIYYVIKRRNNQIKNSFHELSELGIDKIVNKLFNIATNNAIETIDVNIDVGDLVVV